MIKGGDPAQVVSGSTEHRPIERVHGPVVLAVHAQSRVELGLFNGDVGQPAVLRLAANVDVEVMLQRANGRVGEGDGFASFGRRGRAFIRTPTETR